MTDSKGGIEITSAETAGHVKEDSGEIEMTVGTIARRGEMDKGEVSE